MLLLLFARLGLCGALLFARLGLCGALLTAHDPPLPLPPAQIINWGQVVWGNAKLSPSGAITCQHGAAECDLNIMQDCAIDVSSGPAQWLPFIHCLETHGTSQKQFVSKCATSAGISINSLNSCWQGPKGKALVLAAAAATPTDHQYVPWTTVNGVNACDENGCDGVLAAACKAYTGTKPSACAAAEATPRAALRREPRCAAQW